MTLLSVEEEAMRKNFPIPTLQDHELTSRCSDCGVNYHIVKILVNRKGELKFTLFCPKCSQTILVEGITMDDILKFCFDKDFLAMMKIESIN